MTLLLAEQSHRRSVGRPRLQRNASKKKYHRTSIRHLSIRVRWNLELQFRLQLSPPRRANIVIRLNLLPSRSVDEVSCWVRWVCVYHHTTHWARKAKHLVVASICVSGKGRTAVVGHDERHTIFLLVDGVGVDVDVDGVAATAAMTHHSEKWEA